MTKDQVNAAYRELAAWQGACIAIVAKEPGKPDRILFMSESEAESRGVCYPALRILEKRSQKLAN